MVCRGLKAENSLWCIFWKKYLANARNREKFPLNWPAVFCYLEIVLSGFWKEQEKLSYYFVRRRYIYTLKIVGTLYRFHTFFKSSVINHISCCTLSIWNYISVSINNWGNFRLEYSARKILPFSLLLAKLS